jgi:hypothetical protein
MITAFGPKAPVFQTADFELQNSIYVALRCCQVI